MKWTEFQRLTRTMRNKIFLLIGRAILTAINNAEGTQKVQITGLDGETITDIERMQEYGLETYPDIGAEGLGAFINGNRDQGIVIVIHDRRYRPTDLAAGEVC